MRSDSETEREITARPVGDAPDTAPVAVTIVAHDIGHVGGMERQLTALLVGLRELGHEVTVIARTFEGAAEGGIEFHRVRAPGRPFVLAYPWFLLAGSLAVRRWRRGVVQATGSIVLNRVDVVAIHYCHQVGPANPSRSTRLFRGHVRAAGALKRWGERLVLPRAHAAAIVCVSDGVAEEVRRNFPRLAGSVQTIHNGVDTAAFSPGTRRQEASAMRIALALAPDALVAAFVGSEWERKGLEFALRALVGAPQWTLVVVGSGDEPRYRELAGSLGVGERVRWLGVSSDVQLVYQLADAFVLPSSYETFSLVTFEAAASGVPVLATPVSGVRELIDDGRNGFLIERDPEQIATRLRQLGSDPELSSRLGSAARESALAFDRERMVGAHHDLYQRLAEDRDR